MSTTTLFREQQTITLGGRTSNRCPSELFEGYQQITDGQRYSWTVASGATGIRSDTQAGRCWGLKYQYAASPRAAAPRTKARRPMIIVRQMARPPPNIQTMGSPRAKRLDALDRRRRTGAGALSGYVSVCDVEDSTGFVCGTMLIL